MTRFRRWLLYRMCRTFRVHPVPLDHLTQLCAWLRAADNFCDHSGFLRDGTHPGGRHAERTLRRYLQLATNQLKAILEWKAP